MGVLKSMNISEWSFYILVACAVILYYIVPIKFRWFIIFVASFIFVISANGYKLAAITIGIVLWAYLWALVIMKINNKHVIKKFVCCGAVGGIVAALLFFKEQLFFVNTGNVILSHTFTDFRLKAYKIMSPLGISYFSLTLISYICEVYWETVSVEKNPLKFMTYSIYFPTLTSGPILKYKDRYKEIIDGKKFDYVKFCYGLQRIFWGFFKKLVISERLAIYVTTVYSDYIKYDGLYILMAFMAFTFQLYTDFSGCIDIIMGISELFGINLPENFDKPFCAKNLSEFWRRWHITLGAWLREYILYPILKSELFQRIGYWSKDKFGKKTGKKIPTWIALMISWFMIGLWHGGEYKYIYGVGIYMGMMIIIGEMLEPVFKMIKRVLKINEQAFSWRLFQRLRTCLLFTSGLSFFRADSLSSGFDMWKKAIANFNPWIFFDGSLETLGLSVYDFRILNASIFIMAAIGIISLKTNKDIRVWISEQNLLFRWLVWISLIISILVFGMYGVGYNASEFIYGNF